MRPLGGGGGAFQDTAHYFVGEQAHILGEQGKDELHHEVRYGLGIVASTAQLGGDSGDLLTRLLGDAFAVVFGVQPFGVGKGPAQQLPRFGFLEVVNRKAVDLFRGTGEVGMYLEVVEVAHHQQGWVL